MLWVYFRLGRTAPEPSGVSLAHDVSQGYIFVSANWEPKGDLGAPLGHSLGSLLRYLLPLWQHMFAMLVFTGAEG